VDGGQIRRRTFGASVVGGALTLPSLVGLQGKLHIKPINLFGFTKPVEKLPVEKISPSYNWQICVRNCFKWRHYWQGLMWLSFLLDSSFLKHQKIRFLSGDLVRTNLLYIAGFNSYTDFVIFRHLQFLKFFSFPCIT